jgi:hypothetical protein
VRTKGVASIIFLFFLLSLLVLCVVVTMLFPPFLRLGWRPEPRSQTCAVYERVSTRSFFSRCCRNQLRFVTVKAVYIHT